MSFFTLFSRDAALSPPSVTVASQFLLISAGLLALPCLVGAASPSIGPARDDQTVQLNPFNVNESADVGYLAANTLAGSRLNTALKDTPATIDVMTSEFLSDLGATNPTEALIWGNNIQQDLADTAAIGAAGNDNTFFQTAPSFRVRGISATIMRNYLPWNLQMDDYNIDRIEEAHGPNSILFGIGSAGGIINISTKQASLGRSFRTAGAMVGSFGGYRGTLDVNQSTLGGKLAVRVNSVYDHEGDFHTYGFNDSRRIDVASTYQATASTRARVEFEAGATHENLTSYGLLDGLSSWLGAGRPTYASAANANPALGVGKYGTAARTTYVANSNTVINMAKQNFGTTNGNVIEDPSLASPDINGGGPSQLRDTYYTAVTTVLEQRIGPRTDLQFSYNHQNQHSQLYRLGSGDSDGGALSFDPDLTLASGAANPYGGRLMLDGSWQRVRKEFRGDFSRVTASHEEDFHQWGRYRLAALAEYDYTVNAGTTSAEAWAGAPFNAAPENAANLVYRRTYVREGDWGTYYHSGPAVDGLISNLTDPVSGKTLSSTWVRTNSQNNDPTKQSTLLIGGQAHYLSDRLIIGGGYRHDGETIKLRGVARDPASNAFQTDWAHASSFDYTGRTATFGAVAHVTNTISLIYNQSNNFSLPANTLILPDSHPGANPVGKGRDMGISFSLFDDKLSARIVYYQSGVKGATAAHGFGSSTTSPASLTSNILSALVAQGLISQATADARTVQANGISYDRDSSGYELNVVGNLTHNWSVQANYSYTTSAEKNIGPELKAWAAQVLPYFQTFDPNIVAGTQTIGQILANFQTAIQTQFALEGLDVEGNRRQKLNLFTRYAFSAGPLKGLYLGGGYLHQSKTVAGEVSSLGPILFGRSYWLATALAGYRFGHVPLVDRLKLQLNINNLFDADRPLVTSLNPDNSIRRAVPVAPRTWRLSATVEF
jgi:iron complex outermembrane receptor protein